MRLTKNIQDKLRGQLGHDDIHIFTLSSVDRRSVFTFSAYHHLFEIKNRPMLIEGNLWPKDTEAVAWYGIAKDDPFRIARYHRGEQALAKVGDWDIRLLDEPDFALLKETVNYRGQMDFNLERELEAQDKNLEAAVEAFNNLSFAYVVGKPELRKNESSEVYQGDIVATIDTSEEKALRFLDELNDLAIVSDRIPMGTDTLDEPESRYPQYCISVQTNLQRQAKQRLDIICSLAHDYRP